MTYLLDTNVCIRYLNGRSPAIIRQLQTLAPSDIAVCSVVKTELIYGAWRSQTPEKTLQKQFQFLQPFRSYPFDDYAALEAGKLRAWLADQGTPIGPLDLMIAAIALVNELTIVTHNTREFGRVPALSIEDWETDTR